MSGGLKFSYLGLKFDALSKSLGRLISKAALYAPWTMIFLSTIVGVLLTVFFAFGLTGQYGFHIELTSDPELFTPQTSIYSHYKFESRKLFGNDPRFTTVLYSLRDNGNSNDILDYNLLKSVWEQEMILQTSKFNITVDKSNEHIFPNARDSVKFFKNEEPGESFTYEASWSDFCLHQPTGIEPYNPCVVVGVFGISLAGTNSIFSKEDFDMLYDGGLYSFRQFTPTYLPSQLYAPALLRKGTNEFPELYNVRHLLFIYRLKPSLPRAMAVEFENKISDVITSIQERQKNGGGVTTTTPSPDPDEATSFSFVKDKQDNNSKNANMNANVFSMLSDLESNDISTYNQMNQQMEDEVQRFLKSKMNSQESGNFRVSPIDSRVIRRLMNGDSIDEQHQIRAVTDVIDCDTLTESNLSADSIDKCFGNGVPTTALLDVNNYQMKEEDFPADLPEGVQFGYFNRPTPPLDFYETPDKFVLHPDIKMLHYNESFISTETMVIVMRENFLLALTFLLMIVFMAIVVMRKPLLTHGRILLSSSVLLVCGFASTGTFCICTLVFNIPMTAMAPLVVHMLVAMVVDFMIISCKALDSKHDMLEAIAAEDPDAQQSILKRISSTAPILNSIHHHNSSERASVHPGMNEGFATLASIPDNNTTVEMTASLSGYNGFSQEEATDFISAGAEGFASITMTTVATIVAMAVGATIDFPVVRYFFINGCVGVFLLYVFHWTLFLPLLVINERRERAGYLDLLPFVKAPKGLTKTEVERMEEQKMATDIALSLASRNSSPGRDRLHSIQHQVDTDEIGMKKGLLLNDSASIPTAATSSPMQSNKTALLAKDQHYSTDDESSTMISNKSDLGMLMRSYLSLPPVRIGIIFFVLIVVVVSGLVAPHVSTSFDMVTYLPDESRLREFVKDLNQNWNGQGEQLYFNIPGSEAFPYHTKEARELVVFWAKETLKHTVRLNKYPFTYIKNGRQLSKMGSATVAVTGADEEKDEYINYGTEQRFVSKKSFNENSDESTWECFNSENPLHVANKDKHPDCDAIKDSYDLVEFNLPMIGGPLLFWLADYHDQQLSPPSVNPYSGCNPSLMGARSPIDCTTEESNKEGSLCQKAFLRSVYYYLREPQTSLTPQEFEDEFGIKDNDDFPTKLLKQYRIESVRSFVCVQSNQTVESLSDESTYDAMKLPLASNAISSAADSFFISGLGKDGFGPSRMMMVGTQKPGDSAASLIALKTIDMLREDLNDKMINYLKGLPEDQQNYIKNVSDESQFVISHARWLADADRDIRIYPIIVTRLAIIAGALTLVLALILHPIAGLLVGLMIVVIDVIVLGAMYLTNVAVDIVAVLVLCMAVGFSVEYVAHVAHAFVTAPESLRKDKSLKGVIAREHRSLAMMGRIIFYGAMSAFLGIVLLAFAQSSAFRAYFKLTSAVIIVSAVVGLLVTPILLSAFWDVKTLFRKMESSSDGHEAPIVRNTENHDNQYNQTHGEGTSTINNAIETA